MRDFTIDGEVSLACRDWGGDGPDVVLLHGGRGNLDYFDGLAPLLVSHLRVLAYDFRGHGRSGDGPPGADGHVRDLLRVVDHACRGDATIVGASAGSVIAIRAACERRFSHVISVEGLLLDTPDAPGWSEERLARVAMISASMSSQGHPWTGTADELESRLDEIGRWQARSFARCDDGSVTQRPTLEVAADMVVSAKEPFDHLFSRALCPVTAVVGGRSTLQHGSPEAHIAAAHALAAREPNVVVHVADGGHDLVREIPREVARFIVGELAVGPGGIEPPTQGL